MVLFGLWAIWRRQVAGGATPPPHERALGEKIAGLIRAAGPISVADYMAICLFDPEHGYYTTRGEPFGAKGDFITAPEVSQMFGELIAVWLVAAWRACDRPACRGRSPRSAPAAAR